LKNGGLGKEQIQLFRKRSPLGEGDTASSKRSTCTKFRKERRKTKVQEGETAEEKVTWDSNAYGPSLRRSLEEFLGEGACAEKKGGEKWGGARRNRERLSRKRRRVAPGGLSSGKGKGRKGPTRNGNVPSRGEGKLPAWRKQPYCVKRMKKDAPSGRDTKRRRVDGGKKKGDHKTETFKS